MSSMHDDEWFELLSAAADDQLAPQEGAEVGLHLDHCERCASVVAVLQAHRRRARIHPVTAPADLVDAVASAGALAAQNDRHARHRLARRVAMAMAAVVMASAGLAGPVRDSGSGPADPEVVLVAAHDSAFDRSDVRVAVGSTVRWRNDGAETHQLVTDLGNATLQGALEPGGTEAATFTAAGEYQFRCTIHEGMSGTITVAA
jgi:plastocyanin